MSDHNLHDEFYRIFTQFTDLKPSTSMDIEREDRLFVLCESFSNSLQKNLSSYPFISFLIL